MTAQHTNDDPNMGEPKMGDSLRQEAQTQEAQTQEAQAQDARAQEAQSPANAELERRLEEGILEMRGASAGDEVETSALQLQWARLLESMPAHVVALRSCEDYEQLLPAFIAGELSEARRLLVEDHTRSCLTCRRALRQLQSGPRGLVDSMEQRASAVGRWALAAGVLIASALSFLLFWNYGPVSQREVAQVRQIDGQLFALENGGLRPLYPGDRVHGRQELRTSKLGGAVLELNDGSRVEVDARSVVEIERRRSGDRVAVERGRAIVEAAKQRHGSLDVVTSEMRVAVKGTIFAVSHGAKGSRVSVLEGRVNVSQGTHHASLLPGQQMTSRRTMTAVPLAQELAWSDHYDRYRAMIGELRELESDLANLIAQVPRRTSSELLPRAPADTTIYIGLPNPTSTVAEVYALIRERVAANPELFSFWSDVEDSSEMFQIDAIVAHLKEVGDLLGDETVVALRAPRLHGPAGDVAEADGAEVSGVVLSEVRDAAALRTALQAKLEELSEEANEELPIVILDDLDGPAPLTAGAFIWIGPAVLVASNDYELVRATANQETSGFATTEFGQAVAHAYSAGAQMIGAVDLATVLSGSLDGEDAKAVRFAGFDNVKHLLVERHQDGERAYTAGELTFDGDRRGIASWLANPAPMGALEFISPNATFVTASVLKEPLDMLDDLLAIATGLDGELDDAFADIERETGLDVRADLVAPMGGESAFALDGPALPVPSWKYILEVYDPVRLQNTIRILTEKLQAEGHEVTVAESTFNGRIFHELAFETGDNALFKKVSVYYTYVDGFLVAGPTKALVEQAIGNRDAHNSIVGSAAFQELLPTDGYVNFSAIVYNRLGEVLSGLVQRLPMPEGVTDEQRSMIKEMAENLASRGPSLFCLYGEDERIRIVSNTSALLPFAGLEAVFGLGSVLSGLDFSGMAGAVGQSVPSFPGAQNGVAPKALKLEA